MAPDLQATSSPSRHATSSSLSSWLACRRLRDDFAFAFVTPRRPPMWHRLSVVRALRALRTLEPGEFAPPINTSAYERPSLTTYCLPRPDCVKDRLCPFCNCSNSPTYP